MFQFVLRSKKADALSVILIALLIPSAPLGVSAAEVSIVSVDAGRPVRQMAGGIGASWHAIRVEFNPESNQRYQYPVRQGCPQGSAVGANPPLDSTAWPDIMRLGRWLGLDWIRVEIDRRMYERRKGEFDWDNEEMRTLYRILDFCNKNGVDVFLTEMWRDTDWLAYPGVHPLISAPNSLDDFGEGLAALAQHLLREKRYTCVKWLCVANEPPGGTWGYWWSQGATNAPLGPAFKAARQALDKRGISLPISGPDWTDAPRLDPAKMDFASSLGAFDIHSYGPPGPEFSRVMEEWAGWAHQQNKPFFLSEMGDMSLGWGTNNPGPKSFEAALSNAEKIMRGLNAGVDGFNRWSFVNRGDLDGQWQLIRTWDMKAGQYLPHADAEPVACRGYAMLTRFTAKHSLILPCRWLQGQAPGLYTAALKSPKGRITLITVNRSDNEHKLQFSIEGLARKTTLYGYELTEVAASRPGHGLESSARVMVERRNPVFERLVPARSLVVFTSYKLAPDAPGITAE